MMERAFLYGDLLFETIRVYDEKICFIDKHYQRLKRSAELLQFDLKAFSQQIFEQEIQSSLGGIKNARVRFVMYRNSKGYYTPNTNDVKWEVEILPLDVNEKVCKNLGVFNEYKKPCNQLSNIKSGNALVYVMAGLYAKNNKFDDCIILNEHGRIAEVISSNLFLVKGNKLITPPLTEGCVDGVMRKVLIESATEKGIYVEELPLTTNELLQAHEVFLTNSIHGIIPVKSFNLIDYATSFSSTLKTFITTNS